MNINEKYIVPSDTSSEELAYPTLKFHIQIREEWSEFLRASFEGNIEKVVALSGKDDVFIDQSDASGVSALMIASYHGHTEIATFLLEKGAYVNKQENDGWSALTLASTNGHNEVVKMLLDKGAQVDMQN